MKKLNIILSAICMASVLCCTSVPVPTDDDTEEQTTTTPEESSAIPVLSPKVTEPIGAVALTAEQLSYNDAANRFAFKVLEKLYSDKSYVYSPLSLQMALSLAVNGAQGETAREIMDVLGLGQDGMDALNGYSKALLDQLPAVDTTVRLQMANALFVNDKIRLVSAYQDSMEGSYYAPVKNLPFTDEETVMKAVNDWCSLSTNGLIPDILDNVSPFDLAYLLNALYFKGSWNQPFDPKYQVRNDLPFHAAGGNDVSAVYLCSTEALPYLEADAFRMVVRPFGDRGAYQIAILLPKDGFTPADVLKQCRMNDWRALYAGLKGREVFLRVPKFQTNSSHELVETLQALGIRQAFSDKAQFGNMFLEVEACISRVFQKVRFSLDENGAEAAAATLIGTGFTAPFPGEERPEPVEFYADHPFVYTICERTSGTLLFAGVFDGR